MITQAVPRTLAVTTMLASVFASFTMTHADVTLENQHLRVVISDAGGRVSSLLLKDTGWDAAGPTDPSKWQGIAKDRLGVGHDGVLVTDRYTWTEQSATTAAGTTVVSEGPRAGTRIEKRFKLLDGALLVDIVLKAGDDGVPLVDVHNYLPGIGAENTHGFYYADATGVQHYRKSGDASVDVKKPSWYATMSDTGGLIARFTESAPTTLYSYLGAGVTAFEWYYPEVDSGEQLRFAYTLAPFSAASMPEDLREAVAQQKSKPRQDRDKSGPVAHVPPLTTRRPVLSPRKSGYAFVSNIEQVAYVSAQTPSMIHFLPINPSHRPDLYLALPEGITVQGGYRGLELSDAGSREIDGATYRVTRVSLGPNPSKYTLIWRADSAQAWDDGQALKGFFWGKWSEGEQPPQPLTIQVVDVPRVKPFESIPVWMSQPSDLIAIWPDVAALRDTGFNTMDLWTYTREGEEREQWGERVLLESRSRLADVGIQSIAWVREWWWHDGQRDGEDGRAMYIDGKRVDSLNLTYRGTYFQEFIEQGKYLIDRGFYFHSVDPEIYRDGERIDFSPQTIGAFREYLKVHAPKLPYKSPIRFERSPEDHPELHRQWEAFKADRYAAFFADYRQAMEKYIKGQGIDARFQFMAMTTYHRQWEGLYDFEDYRDSPVYRITLEDPKAMAEVFDYLAPMIYTDVYANYDDYDMKLPWKDTIVLHRLAEGKADIAPLLCAGYPFFDGFGSDLSAPLLKANMLETVAGGGRGFGVWGECPIDARDFKVVAEVVGMLQPYEAILLSAKPSDQINAVTDNVFAKRLSGAEGSLVLISEYSDRQLEAVIACPVSEPSVVIDLSSGKTLGELDADEHTFTITLGDERAMMLYVGKPRK